MVYLQNRTENINLHNKKSIQIEMFIVSEILYAAMWCWGVCWGCSVQTWMQQTAMIMYFESISLITVRCRTMENTNMVKIKDSNGKRDYIFIMKSFIQYGVFLSHSVACLFVPVCLCYLRKLVYLRLQCCIYVKSWAKQSKKKTGEKR